MRISKEISCIEIIRLESSFTVLRLGLCTMKDIVDILSDHNLQAETSVSLGYCGPSKSFLYDEVSTKADTLTAYKFPISPVGMLYIAQREIKASNYQPTRRIIRIEAPMIPTKICAALPAIAREYLAREAIMDVERVLDFTASNPQEAENKHGNY